MWFYYLFQTFNFFSNLFSMPTNNRYYRWSISENYLKRKRILKNVWIGALFILSISMNLVLIISGTLLLTFISFSFLEIPDDFS